MSWMCCLHDCSTSCILLGVCFSLYLLSFVSKVVNYTCKMFLYSLVFLIIAIIHMVYCPFFPKNRDNTWALAPIFYWLARFATGIKVEAEGTEHLDQNDVGYIIACNHQSSLDTHCMARIYPHRAIILMKKSLMYVPFFGWAAYLSGHEFIDRSNKGGADVRDHMLLINERIKSERLRVIMFPEGTRNKAADGKMLPFKKGGFHMAQQCQSPIVPIVVHMPASIYDKKNWVFNSGTVTVKVLPAIAMEGTTPEDVSGIVAKTQDLMQQTLDQMNKRE